MLEDVKRDHVAILMCSSGSTGDPKAIKITSYALVATSTLALTGRLPVPGDSTQGIFLPSSIQWSTYIVTTNLVTIFHLRKYQSPKPSTATHVIENFRKYKPEFGVMPPGLLTEILRSPDLKPEDFSHVLTFLVGGAFVSVDLQIQFKEIIHPQGLFLVGCGATEVIFTFLFQTPNSPLDSLGKERNLFDVKIVGDDGNEAPIGTTGEVWVKGKSLYCKGYYNDEKASKETFTEDGWYKTGDLMYKKENGFFYYVERKKFLLKYGSYHIYPVEVESVISELKGVTGAGVCWTERGLTALVQTAPGAQVTEQQVIDHVKSKLSFFKVPTGGMYFGKLPTTASGKLNRLRLLKTIEQIFIDEKDGKFTNAIVKSTTVA